MPTALTCKSAILPLGIVSGNPDTLLILYRPLIFKSLNEPDSTTLPSKENSWRVPKIFLFESKILTAPEFVV